jgi:hypothetical protein
MHYIAHRVNSINELLNIPIKYGVEVDLRDYGDRIILQHDPFKNGENFEEYLKHYNHGTIILNIKSEGIEFKVLELLKKYNINNYFFLDSSFPVIHSLCLKNEKNIALRFSEFEGIDTICLMSKKVDWIWVDCFRKLPITGQNYKLLKNHKYKLCLVSPELQGQDRKLESYKNYLQKEGIVFDAICTKVHNITRWMY